MAAVDSFDLVVEGTGGHGAMPHRSVDPVVVAADVVSGLQRIVSREIDPIEPAVVTIGAINGGTTYNVIPPRVALKGTVRTMTERDARHDGRRASAASPSTRAPPRTPPARWNGTPRIPSP